MTLNRSINGRISIFLIRFTCRVLRQPDGDKLIIRYYSHVYFVTFLTELANDDKHIRQYDYKASLFLLQAS